MEISQGSRNFVARTESAYSLSAFFCITHQANRQTYYDNIFIDNFSLVEFYTREASQHDFKAISIQSAKPGSN